jgi:hypothetical protein
MQENRLHLIVCVVRQEDPVGAMPGGARLKKQNPGAARRHLDRNAFPCGARPDILGADLHFQPIPAGQFRDECGVGLGIGAAKLVIQVTEHELAATGGPEGLQEGHGIPTSGNPEQKTGIRTTVRWQQKIHRITAAPK